MSPQHVYFRIAARSVERGWLQNGWRDDDGNVCLLQAVMDAMSIESHTEIPVSVLLSIDAQLMGTGTYCQERSQKKRRRKALKRRDQQELVRLIYGWNDQRERTAAQVADVLRRTAEYYEGVYRPYLREIIQRAYRPVKGIADRFELRNAFDTLEV